MRFDGFTGIIKNTINFIFGCLIAFILLSALALGLQAANVYADTGDRCGGPSEVGSVKPQDAASSQKILDEMECRWLESVIGAIGTAFSHGMTQEQLTARLRPAEEIGEDEYNKVLRLIESAYEYKGPIIDWQNLRYKPCHRD